MDKRIAGAAEAVSAVGDGATVMIGGFGLSGNPENLVAALHKRGSKNLTIISNNAGVDDFGIGTLIRNGQVKKMIMSYGGECQAFEQMALDGSLEVEWNPQGTLAERIRAGGAGIGGFFTPTGYGTLVAEGKETREIDGRWQVFEKPLKADFALIKAWKGDELGNLVYRKTARNFNQVMATAASRVFAEVEQLVAAGQIDGDAVHTPGVYVDAVFQGPRFVKPIEKVTVRQRPAGGS
ncbi:MAG: CoA transferase subunit A [Elusimicrobia bacterium]|nr:CoA transferase subunit A [Elusimicrobiota bacterium]MDE2425245.1 CoA transferase subunit A [Elusimicrobiota bacterium]